jgi:hypothetical protein
MSERAREFIDHWESEHVNAVPDFEKAREAKELAIRCQEDALRAGITAQDLEAAVGGNLIGNMLEALEAAETGPEDSALGRHEPRMTADK